MISRLWDLGKGLQGRRSHRSGWRRVGGLVFKECQAGCPLPSSGGVAPLYLVKLTYIPGMQPSSPF